jgi:hypothetical protein
MNSCTIIKSITYSAYYNPAYQALGRPQYWPHFSGKANSYATSNDRANVIQKASGIENNIVKVEISTRVNYLKSVRNLSVCFAKNTF